MYLFEIQDAVRNYLESISEKERAKGETVRCNIAESNGRWMLFTAKSPMWCGNPTFSFYILDDSDFVWRAEFVFHEAARFIPYCMKHVNIRGNVDYTFKVGDIMNDLQTLVLVGGAVIFWLSNTIWTALRNTGSPLQKSAQDIMLFISLNWAVLVVGAVLFPSPAAFMQFVRGFFLFWAGLNFVVAIIQNFLFVYLLVKRKR